MCIKILYKGFFIFANILDIKSYIILKILLLIYIYFKNFNYKYFYNFIIFSIFLINIIVFKILIIV